MFREIVIAAAVVGGAVVVSPSAIAGGTQRSYPGDVPGITYDAHLSAPCYRWDRYIFGRGPGGEALACHFIQNLLHRDGPSAGGYGILGDFAEALRRAGGGFALPGSAGRGAVTGRPADAVRRFPRLAARLPQGRRLGQRQFVRPGRLTSDGGGRLVGVR